MLNKKIRFKISKTKKHSPTFSSLVHSFSDEELKEHDKQVIQNFVEAYKTDDTCDICEDGEKYNNQENVFCCIECFRDKYILETYQDSATHG